ncbi:glycosyltransferase [Mariniphaga sediminis]|uniref:Glycosyltransferase n=1 Tax=Mariniphaga sediminis TaxID=1628158 RepID=A0A399D2J6_9BACT|nr:glycosyltransferase [Mariniphaga sediminis]RIH66094.1 glycosyltransferase [Mariniphaga sediminis]
MSEIIIITPVKDSPATTEKTIEAVCQSDCAAEYFVYDDFSGKETKELLIDAQKKWGFHLIHMEDLTNKPSPNYKLVLQEAQKTAIKHGKPLAIVESDVIVHPNTFRQLLEIVKTKPDAGLVGAITVDQDGKYNFPYNFEKSKNTQVIDTSRSLSFCCTLLSLPFLEAFNFEELSQKKDWFDVTISHQARKLGFRNYLAKGIEVLHLPHSSRPWKQLKYSNPLLYYIKKLIHQRDRI